jgi:hypothetical protein
MADTDLLGWREVVADQLAPGGQSLTVSILARVLRITPLRMAELMDDATLHNELAKILPTHTLARLEEAMYVGVRDIVARYVADEIDVAEASV